MTSMTAPIPFSELLRHAFEFYKRHILTLLSVTLAATALGIVSGGILAGPMLAGVVWVTLRLLDRDVPAPAFGDVFKGFDYFLPAFLFFAIWALVRVALALFVTFVFQAWLAPFVQLAVSLGMITFLMFGFFLIVDGRRAFWPATVESVVMARRHWPFLLAVVFVAMAISLCGLLALGIGVVVTLPMGGCIAAIVYRALVPKMAEE